MMWKKMSPPGSKKESQEDELTGYEIELIPNGLLGGIKVEGEGEAVRLRERRVVLPHFISAAKGRGYGRHNKLLIEVRLEPVRKELLVWV